MNKNKNWWLIKIDRVFAWILLFSMFLYFLTGYGITKQIINSTFASNLHLDILPLVIMIAFAVHSSLAIRLALIRWRVWNRFSMTTLILIYIFFLAGFGYVEIFYKNNKTTKSTEMVSSQDNIDDEEDEGEVEDSTKIQPITKTETKTQSESSTKTFTASELEKYNGQNGAPAYVAVDGIVYDLSSVFKDGSHYSHLAGKDLTNAFYREHVKSEISKYPIVGEVK